MNKPYTVVKSITFVPASGDFIAGLNITYEVWDWGDQNKPEYRYEHRTIVHHEHGRVCGEGDEKTEITLGHSATYDGEPGEIG